MALVPLRPPPPLKHVHKFVFLRQKVVAVDRDSRDMKTYDVFFCEQCLTYKEVEVDTHG